MNGGPLAGKRAVVVGGGWAGIASAWRLREAGADVELLDAQDQLGGRSRGVPLGDRFVTLGGKNIGKNYTRFRGFVTDHGGGNWEDFGISTSQVEDGRLTPVEGRARRQATMHLLRRARPSDVILLLRLARAVTADSSNRFLDGPAFMRAARGGDLPLSEVFGSHVARRLIRPMTMRMNGAEPDEAFLGNLGTNLSLVLDSFDQLVDGFEPVLAQFGATVTVRKSSTVTSILQKAGAVSGVTYASPTSGGGRIDADIVVLAVPAPAAALLTMPFDDSTAATLAAVPYHPVAVVVAEYDSEIFGEVGRAVILPEESVLSNAGAYGKADRRTVRYTFSGRASRKLLASRTDTQELLLTGERELEPFLPLRGAKAMRAVSHVWRDGLCAYGPDHHLLSERLQRAASATRGLAFAGDYVAGASIEACFVSAERALATLMFRPAEEVR